jgi:hypothetical protein
MQSHDSVIAAAASALAALTAGNRMSSFDVSFFQLILYDGFFCLNSFAALGKIQKIIRENGGIKELVRLLQHQNDTIVSFVTATILELIQDDGTYLSFRKIPCQIRCADLL